MVATPAAGSHRVGALAATIASLGLVALALPTAAWMSGSGLHTTLEACATLLAAAVGTLSLVRYYSQKITPYQILGAGFLAVALLDGYHLLATSTWFAASLPSAHTSVMGWSWMTGRLTQGLVLWLAYWAWSREQTGQSPISDRRYYWATGLLVVAGFLVIATLPMPTAYGRGWFAQPLELVPAVLFTGTLAGFWRKQRVAAQSFDFWLMVSLVFGAAGQAFFMATSQSPYDAAFDLAHIVKLGSYGVVLAGLLLSVHATYRAVDAAADQLRDTNLQLQEEIQERKARATELREAMEAAEAANLAKSQFLANMSHELRTPLNSVIGFANILGKNKKEHLDKKELYYLERVLDNGKHLLGLINDVLDLSKIEAGKMEFEIAEVKVQDLIPQVLAQFESLVRDRDLKLCVDLPDELAPIRTDEARFRQVLMNLIGNAVKFTETGAVTVRVVSTGQQVARVDVVDTGIGIPAERVEAVFDSFTQAENGADRKYEGTGLGLAISRTLCRELGHDLMADSVEGDGSTFSVMLAGDAAPPRHGSISAAVIFHGQDEETTRDPVENGELAGRLVLIIDDNQDCQTLIRHFAEETGCRALICDSGADGIELARRHRPDLILLDLMMPDMDGWEVLRRLKSEVPISRIPVAVVSIVATDNAANLKTAAAVLDKPFERAELFDMLHRLLADADAERLEATA
ncbi:MAG: response regulator [Acidobacteria bacterium]|nr:response regulator [Acidobacteriota bacterium]